MQGIQPHSNREWMTDKQLVKLHVFSNGCPICGGPVRGNDYYKFYCNACSLLFPRNAINYEDEYKPK